MLHSCEILVTSVSSYGMLLFVCGLIWFEIYKCLLKTGRSICHHLKILKNQLRIGVIWLQKQGWSRHHRYTCGGQWGRINMSHVLLAVISLSWAEAILKLIDSSTSNPNEIHMRHGILKVTLFHHFFPQKSCNARTLFSPISGNPQQMLIPERVPRQAMALIRWKSNGTFLTLWDFKWDLNAIFYGMFISCSFWIMGISSDFQRS